MDPQAIAVKPCSVPLPSHYCHCSPQLAVTCSHLPPPCWADPPPFPCLYNERAEEGGSLSALLRQNFVILVEAAGGIEGFATDLRGARTNKEFRCLFGLQQSCWCPAEPARVQVSWTQRSENVSTDGVVGYKRPGHCPGKLWAVERTCS